MEFTVSGQTVVRNVVFVFAEDRLYFIGVTHTSDLAPSLVAAFLDSFQFKDANETTSPPATVPTAVPAVAPVPATAPASDAITADDFKPVACAADKFVVGFPGKYEVSDIKERHSRS